MISFKALDLQGQPAFQEVGTRANFGSGKERPPIPTSFPICDGLMINEYPRKFLKNRL